MNEADVRWRERSAQPNLQQMMAARTAAHVPTSSCHRLLTSRHVASAAALLLLTAAAAAEQAALVARVDADLAARNLTVCDEHLCRPDAKRPKLEEDFDDRGCLCDLACAAYGDCCRDVTPAGSARGDLTCRRLRHYDGIYMVSACPAAWPDAAVRRLCERRAPLDEDPFAGLPVSSPTSRFTYSNYYCAMCHGDAADAVFWRTRVECPTLTRQVRAELNVTEDFAAENLQRDAAGRWGVPVAEGGRETFHLCEIDPFFTETIAFFVRRCRASVAGCAANWTDAETAALCGAYNAYVYDADNNVYRNAHCALCSHVPAEETFCVRRPMLRSGLRGDTFNSRAFSILLDMGDRSGSDEVGVVRACLDGQLWDPFFKRCRAVVCDAAGYRLRDGACVPTDDGADAEGAANATEPMRPVANDTAATPFLLCPKFHLNASDYEPAEEDAVYVPLYDRTFTPGQYELHNGTLVVCAITEQLSKFDRALSYVSLACLAASVLCLLLHLAAFCLVSEIRNLSGRNLAALSVCLLVGYVCFLVLPTQPPGEAGCAALAVIMFAAFIASFFWMNVMAFDVFMTLRKATKELRVSSGRHAGRFALYGGYVFLMTAVVVAAAVLVDHSPAVPAAYRPGFGDRVCWFSRRRALAVFFAAPLAAVMGVNVVMFVASAHMIRETTKSTASMTCGPSQVNLRLYSRLAIIMGLSWVVGLLAGWLDFPPLWYAFVVLNTLQGVFIFVSFTLADKVRDRLSRQASQWASSSGSRSLAADSGVHTDSSSLSANRSRL